MGSLPVAHPTGAAAAPRLTGQRNGGSPNSGTLALVERHIQAAAYGLDKFLFVYGDFPASGVRSGDLSVRAMIGEASILASRPGSNELGIPGGAASGLVPLPAWKQEADSFFVQVGFSVERNTGVA